MSPEYYCDKKTTVPVASDYGLSQEIKIDHHFIVNALPAIHYPVQFMFEFFKGLLCEVFSIKRAFVITVFKFLPDIAMWQHAQNGKYHG